MQTETSSLKAANGIAVTDGRVYIFADIREWNMSHRAKVFQSGNSQAVRLPREFRFAVDEVEITREGDAVILRPKPVDDAPWSSLRAAVKRGFSEDFLRDGREQPSADDRPGLDALFR